MADEDQEPVSGWQMLFDDPSMLLFIGIATPTLIYTLWGVLEVAHIPVAGY